MNLPGCKFSQMVLVTEIMFDAMITHRGIQWMPGRLQYMQTYQTQRNMKRIVSFISNCFFSEFCKMTVNVGGLYKQLSFGQTILKKESKCHL